MSKPTDLVQGTLDLLILKILALGPLNGSTDRVFTIVGQPEPAPDAIPAANYRIISPQYFRTLEVPLLKGRGATSVT